MKFEEAIAKAIAAALEADQAQDGRDNRVGLIDPDTSARRSLAWSNIAAAIESHEWIQRGQEQGGTS